MLGVTLTGVSALPSVSPASKARGTVQPELKLLQRKDRLDVIITGAGPGARVSQQRQLTTSWQGVLTLGEGAGPVGSAQKLSMQSLGLAMVQLRSEGSATTLRVEAVPGQVLSAPEIRASGDDLIISFTGLSPQHPGQSSGRLDLTRPGRVAQPGFVPPMRPRAVAPPLGDMAVGTMLINNRSFVQVSGPSVSLTLNNAPAKDALMSLARLGGYGFVFVGDGGGAAGNSENASGVPVSMAFRNERFDRALNSVLLASGLQGKMDGRTLLVGTSVAAKTFGPQMSKVFRLNQVDVEGAAQYLASMGASMTHVKTIQITTGEAATAGATQISNTASQTTNQVTETETYGSATGPLVGLSGVTNSRLNTVTLVGDPGLINIAESYLRQLDLRNRQVAVNVQILSVSLTNDKTIDASFSARMGDKYVVSESGKAHMNFGRYRPGSRSGTGLIQEGGPVEPGTYAAGTARVAEQQVFDPPFVEAQQVVTNAEGETELVPRLDQFGRPIYVPSTDPAATPALKPVLDRKGRPIYVDGQDPARFQQPQDSFYAYVESLITSSSAKTLAEPTLIVQEGEQAQVETGQSVITGVDATETANGSTQFQNTRENAGLTVDVSVQKIDDNGFVTLTLDPEISVPIPAGTQQGVAIFNIQARKLRSGRVRLRDGQSLILTGVINEQDRQQVQKWPILGDIPLIGQLFRQSASSRVKDELVIIVTPRILDDDQGGSFGYGYRAGTSASRQLVQSRP